MTSAHEKALEEAVSNGTISPEQAEWLQEHMEWMWGQDGGYHGFGGHCGGYRFYNSDQTEESDF